MINRLTNCCLLVASLIIVVGFTAGCEQAHKQETLVYEYGPWADPNLVVPVYAERAIEAAGGRQAWENARKLCLDCVLTFYQPDGSFYLTEQRHEVCPWAGSVRISAEEPQGKVICQLSPDKFGVVEGDYRLYSLPIGLKARFFAEAILDITIAPLRFLDRQAEFTKRPEPVKIKGKWYHPIEVYRVKCEPNDVQGTSYVTRERLAAVFYQNRDSSLVDMICFAGVDGDKFLTVRGYDYRKIEKNSVAVPAKIEIFRTDAAGTLQQRLVKIDYYLLKHFD